MFPRSFHWLALCAACQGDPAPAPLASRPVIEVSVMGKVTAKVLPGHPCRATIDVPGAAAIDLQVGGPPLVATVGNVRWTAETGSNGTTFKKNDEPVARIHANQLFDAQGIPLIKVSENGAIANGPGRVLRKATVVHGHAPQIEIKTMVKRPEDDAVVTGTEDTFLATVLAAPEAEPTIRGLVACHILLSQGT